MLSLISCSHSCPHLVHRGRMERSKALQVAMKPINRTSNKGNAWQVGAWGFQGLQKIDWIRNRSDKSFKEKYVRVALENAYASEFEEKEENSTKSQNFLWKKLKAFYEFTRPSAVVLNVILVTTSSLLPVQTIKELSPALFAEIFKVVVATTSMFVYIAGVNQLNDVEIDKINKPYLPLASGDFSIEAGVAITFAALSMSLVMGIMSSPALFSAILICVLTATMHAIDLPLLRWKKRPYVAIISNVIMIMGHVLALFAHIQKYVLGKPMMITRSLVFAMATSGIFFTIITMFKDIPDEEGDKEHGIQSLSLKLGKKNVFWLCINMLLMAYGAAVVVGVTSSSLLSRLITIIGHFLLASLVLLRAQSIDLNNNASTTSFYMFIWQLYCVGCFLPLFVR
ncbi:hypothetical protein SLA2020_484780 [Shorea laevis]